MFMTRKLELQDWLFGTTTKFSILILKSFRLNLTLSMLLHDRIQLPNHLIKESALLVKIVYWWIKLTLVINIKYWQLDVHKQAVGGASKASCYKKERLNVQVPKLTVTSKISKTIATVTNILPTKYLIIHKKPFVKTYCYFCIKKYKG